MGQQASQSPAFALRFCYLDRFWMYVANSAHVHSKCSDCCELDIDTDLVSVSASDSEDAARGVCCL